MYDAVIVGAGPNGLAAAIELARNGRTVLLLEANDTVGGSARTEELTLPGFRHDVGSAIYPLGVGSPFFSSLPLHEHGLKWVHPDVPLAHPLDQGRAVLLERDLDATAARLGADGKAYHNLVGPFAGRWPAFSRGVLDSPFRPPRNPLLMARFGRHAIRPTTRIAQTFRGEEARALLAGNAAHAGTPLEHRLTGAVGLTLMTAAHAVGWPLPQGGAGQLTAALASYFQSLGGTIETGRRVSSLEELPKSKVVLLALTFAQVARVVGPRLHDRHRRRLSEWRYGPGAFKVDWALDGPIPWRSPDVARAATVHLGGTFEEIAESERAPWLGTVTDRPFVLLAQPTLFDPTRAPEGRHTAWAYCHVPNGWAEDMTEAIESQVERFAPGFRQRVLARATHSPAQLEEWNANLVGGDVNGGALTVGQMLGPARWGLPGWRPGSRDIYVCSASTPPGGGVHGMSGYHAARTALASSLGGPRR